MPYLLRLNGAITKHINLQLKKYKHCFLSLLPLALTLHHTPSRVIDSSTALRNDNPSHTVQPVLWKSPPSEHKLFFQVDSAAALKITTQTQNPHEPWVHASLTGLLHCNYLKAVSERRPKNPKYKDFTNP